MLLVSGVLAASPLLAVYAPIPEPEQGKDLLVTVRGGVSHDTNIFGAARGAVASTIFTLAPRVTYNHSLTDQTFISGSYGLTLDQFQDRPGDKLVDSHDLTARVAHAFTRSTTIDVFNMLSIARNPESTLPGVGALPGVTLNADQSYTRNQLDGRFNTPLTPKASVTVKARSIYYEYRDDALGRNLDRIENLYGVAGDYAVLPEVKMVGEYRHQDVYYRKQGETKNKTSDYLMGGADYNVAKKLAVSGRLGAEWRSRSAESDTVAPYAELSGKYDLTERSFIVAGYAYTFEESSDIARFTDSQVNRFFANAQHAVTPLIVLSGSLTFEPSVLQGRRGQVDVDEDTTRLGGAASYLANKNWTLSLSYDYDRVKSDDAPRNLRRERVGLNAIYSF